MKKLKYIFLNYRAMVNRQCFVEENAELVSRQVLRGGIYKCICSSLDKNALWLHLKDGHLLFMTIRVRYHLINIRDMCCSSFTFLPLQGCDDQIQERHTLTQSRHSQKMGNSGNVVTQTRSITTIYLKYVFHLI